MLKAINSDILFKFVQKIQNGSFVNETNWGLTVNNPVEDVKQARWAEVLHIGPEVDYEDIKVGEYVLIEPLMWTNKISYNGTDYWKTNETKILATSTLKPTNLV